MNSSSSSISSVANSISAQGVWQQIKEENEGTPYYSDLSTILKLQQIEKPAKTSIDDLQWIKQDYREELKVLFKKYCFTSSICLHDLIGLHMYYSFYFFKDYLNPNVHNGLRSEFASIYLRAYCSLLYLSHGNKITSNTKLFFDFHQYSKYLSDFSEKLKNELSSFQERRARESNKKVNSLKYLKKLELSWQDKLKQWNTARLILGTLFFNPNGLKFITDTPLCTYKEADSLESQSEEDGQFAVTTLKNYADLINHAQQEAYRREETAIQFPAVQTLKELIVKLNLEEGAATTKKKCHDLLQFIEKTVQNLFQYYISIEEKIEKATNDKLTHEQFCKEQEINLTAYYSKYDFIGFLIQIKYIVTLYMAWFRDFSRTIDRNVLQALDASHHTFDVYFNRMLVNLWGISSALMPHLGDLSETPFVVEMRSLQLEFNQFFLSSKIQGIIKAIVKTNVQKGRDDTYTVQMLYPIYEDLEKLIPLCLEKFKKIKNEHSQEWSNYPFVENTQWFSRILILFHDIGIMLRRKKAEGNDGIFPEEFLDLMPDPILPPAPLPIPEPTPSVSPISPPPISQPLPSKKTSLPLPLPVKISPLPDPQEILSQTKTRKIEQILNMLGFEPIRTAGSHTTWKNPDTGAQTVVPDHKELPRGTVQSIYHQITAKKTS